MVVTGEKLDYVFIKHYSSVLFLLMLYTDDGWSQELLRVGFLSVKSQRTS